MSASRALASYVSCKDEDSWTPLHHAVDGNHLAAARVLVSRGAAVNAANCTGDTPLHLALRWNFSEPALFLLDQPGISIEAQNEDGWTALHEACCSGAAEAVAPLLAKGADVNARCKDGSTPLHKAARCGSKAIVSSLLRAGADLKARDKASPAQLHDGMEPEDVAVDDAIEWSVNGETRQMYESRWQHFVSRTKGKKTVGKLGYKDVPWPAEEGCSAEDLQAILLSGTKAPEEKKKRLKAELLRWHPDKFTGHFAHYFAESDRQRILARTYAQYPQLGLSTTPFVIPSVKTYAALTKPYEIPSKQYDADYNESKAYGSKNSTARSQYQTDTGYLWLSSTGTSTIVGYWNLVAREVVPSDLSLLQTAKLLAHLNVAAYDAQIVAFYQKYTYQVWRPITGIRQGSFSNEADPTWTPLVVTPFHPDYPSTHSVASGVAQTVLTRWLGTDNATYTITAEDGKAPPRTFTSLSDGALDSAKSRIYVGAHWPLAIYDGLTLGNKVADYVFSNLDSTVGWSSVTSNHAGHGSSASAPASAPQGSNTAAAIASAPAPGAVTSASVGRRLLAADLS
ncbi:hypothetical protein COCSUDRAFT_42315 [Coccomyxa subellipsoidea C-169]|uniref:Phosphatidic acid phosphatase type 2/haloperoxidase domain-containing protein n=1 Tax=Coccomyxa subellipsoidea (strain C-169) TaxID=574566 RepID=I0YW92_COCSC|nr:hypothetical protein COCSUDRAFT_42315 [Coccomyxa subellipsoidea C-169]EIE22661.1 hypothetical protein COCSUDRAFT_42315 [Coccomyxa subellipsoidea C-169]|eukprot:XP_005647205.1 hypothetical protein COCSUDRAFT_42315 [Coccomyxa subellipsoidea C-169]